MTKTRVVRTKRELLIPSEGTVHDTMILKKSPQNWVEFECEIDYKCATFRINKRYLMEWLLDNSQIKPPE